MFLAVTQLGSLVPGLISSMRKSLHTRLPPGLVASLSDSYLPVIMGNHFGLYSFGFLCTFHASETTVHYTC